MKRFIFILVVMSFTMGIFISGIVPSANAAFILSLSDGASSVTITDGGVGDSNGATGAITYIGAVGTNWTINVTTGLSKPVLGNSNSAVMDLNSVNTSSTGAGSLIIELRDTGFTLPVVGNFNTLIGQIGGTTIGTVDFVKYYEGPNGVLGTIHLGPFGPGAFSGSQTMSVPAINPFSMRDVVTIEHTNFGVTSFDAYNEVNPVPEPGTLILIGAGLVGIAGYSKLKLRRRKKAISN